MMKLKTNKFFTKEQEKIRNKKNKDQIEKKKHIINLYWMMKLKTNKNCKKRSRKKD